MLEIGKIQFIKGLKVWELCNLDLPILGEWGYVLVDKGGSQLMFRIVSDSYESRSMILTTNLEFSKWGSIFTDDQMVEP